MNVKKIAIAGSTGFIAGKLIKELKEYEIIHLIRNDFYQSNEQLAEKINTADIIINLTGYPIIKRWTKSNMKKIYDSRINTTSKLVRAMMLLDRNIHFINASAIGIYSAEGIHNEESMSFSEGFIYKLILDWENEAMKAKEATDKISILRIGIVLTEEAGLIKKIYPMFKAGLGGRLGTGEQWMSFIHINDLINAIKFIIHKELTGIINLTAPNNVTNIEFTKTLSGLLNKPAFIVIPVLLLKLLYGKGSKIIYSGHRVLPEKLLNQGFIFKYPDINSAIQEIIVH
jgi:hypothetical protein